MISLPTCRWRGAETEPGWYACGSAKLIKGKRGVHGEQHCLRCPYVDHEGPAAPTPSRDPVHKPCVHLGAETGVEQCPTCAGTVRVKLFACELHGVCSLQKQLPGKMMCGACPDYQERE